MLLVYLSERALILDARDQELYRLARRIVIRRRTPFVGAELSGAAFTGTHIGRADITNAIVFDATLPSVRDQAEAE